MAIFSSLCTCIKTPELAAAETLEEVAEGESSSLFFDLHTLQVATGFFSELNQLGRGGFGTVYKGLMPNGQEIAVKKLFLTSRQGIRGFTNEVKLLSTINHINLVRLMGCCVEGLERMLVYEYLSNKSLDCFLFDKEKSASLDWITRFRIITGVARGLLYLHEEAHTRIIHTDIKASNILLDDQLNPKISDFGLTRLFPLKVTHVGYRISGTRGYIAPEYAMHGYLSGKSDVFSYGVLVLEIISGRKNHDSQLGGKKADLLSYTWKLFQEGKSLDLLDSSLAKYNFYEAAKCIQLGLLCCQASSADRPDMKSVLLKLSSDSFALPRPGKPGLQGRPGCQMTTTTSAVADTDASSTQSGATDISTGTRSSRNAISASSYDEGR